MPLSVQILHKWTLATVLMFVSGYAISQKPTLKPDDYKQWERLGAPQISDDGHWVSYGISLVDGDGRLVIKNSDTAVNATIPNGIGARFSDDSQWVAYIISPPKAAIDAFRAQPPSPNSKPPQSKMGLRSLATGTERVMENVAGFGFLKGSDRMWFMRPAQGPLAELVILNLKTGEPLAFPNVRSVVLNKAETLLAFISENGENAHALQLLDLKTNVIRSLSWGREAIRSVDFAEKSPAIAFMTMVTDEKKDGDSAIIRVIANPQLPNSAVKTLQVNGKEALKGLKIPEYGGLDLSEDGTMVSFGTQPWKDKVKPEGKPEEKAVVDVWNWKDVRTIPEQKVQAEADKRKCARWIWHLNDDSILQIANADQQGTLLKDFKHAIISDDKPYEKASTNGWSYADIWLLDTVTGAKKRIFEKTHWPAVPSRDGNYIAHFERKHWWVYDLKSERTTNVTIGIKTSFENVEDDHTVPEKPPTSFPQWLRSDEGFIINDKYDAFLIRPQTNSSTQLTDGRKDHQMYRLLNIDPKNEEGITAREKMYFTFMDEDTRGTGFYAADSLGKGKILFAQEALIGSLTKSKNTDRTIFTMESYEKSPNLFLSNLDFTAAKQESKTNPQQEKFAWGKTELIKFKSRWGVPLQGTLIYPADYKPGQKYPMVTYIYERLSQGFNQYIVPSEWSAYNQQVFSQNGYFVFMPDIAYKGRNPGINAQDCLEPAVATVLAKNVGVDPTKVGLIGHSWGGYQTAFVTSVSKTFSVGIAGAPLTELTSMYNTHYWNAGITNQVLLETGQGRLEVPFWEDPKVYFDNSAVWQSKKRIAPILVTVGDKDGAVDYHQGIALYNTLRRMGKECVLLVYADENHNFTKRPDQLDYAKRVRHFFDVYLKGAKPDPWIVDGVPFLKY